MSTDFQTDPHRTGGATWDAFLALVIADESVCVPMQLIGAITVHAADEHRGVGRSSKRVGKGRRAGIQVIVVAPALILIRMATGEHGHTRWSANRRDAVAVVKRDAAGR
jgi:hypothetical protein